MESSIGFAHFLTHTDALGRTVLLLLLLMSLASWYLTITKALVNYLAGRRADAFLKRFWEADSLRQVRSTLLGNPPAHAFARIAQEALDAAGESEQHGMQKLAAAGGLGEFLVRLLRNGIDQEAARDEYGLTLLASAGSVAPYIGLFGTVWGIYHALAGIGLSGENTLEQVAGPVGEALIMTALGLAVAIPAVLAYNAFNRRNRVWIARLDAFAHDLYAAIMVGERTTAATGVVRPLHDPSITVVPRVDGRA